MSRLFPSLRRLSRGLLPARLRVRGYRHERGRREYKKLQRADAVLVSFPKSGRTWVRVMLSHFLQRRFGLPEGELLSSRYYRQLSTPIPRLHFTHDHYLGDYLGHRGKEAYAGKRVLLLARDPRDIAVSTFFHHSYRGQHRKNKPNGIVYRGEAEIFAFVSSETVGIPRIVRVLNEWAQAAPALPHFLLLRYEDLRRDPALQLRQLLTFLDLEPSTEELEAAIAFGSIDNMRQLEKNSGFDTRSRRLNPGDLDNPDSYKVRRGKVGGYRDYFDEEQLAALDRLVVGSLAPLYGYGPTTQQPERDA